MSRSGQTTDAWKGYGLAALAATCWATSGVLAKWVMSPLNDSTKMWVVPPPGVSLDPTVLAGTRAATALVLLLVYLGIRRPKTLRIEIRQVPFLAMFGIIGMAGLHVAYYQAISHSNVATAVLLEYLAPIAVLVFSVLFLGEVLTWTLPAGVTMSIVGCALVVGAFGSEGLAVSGAGVAWGLTAAALFAFYQLVGKWASTRFSPWTLLSYGLGFATIFWIVYLGGPSQIIAAFASPGTAVAILYLGAIGTVVPFAASLKALHFIDATKAVVTSTLEPVLAGLIAWVTLREFFGPLQLLGGAIVVGAIVLVQRSPSSQAVLPPVP